METVVIFFIAISLFVVRAEILTDSMSRNPEYDNKNVHPTKTLTTLNFRSLLQCATFCRSNINCKAVFYNLGNSFCQLLSACLDPADIIGKQDSQGWIYYEFKKQKCNQWHNFNQHQYKLDRVPRNFTASQVFCSSLNEASYIIEVNSQDENDWLVNLTKDICGSSGEYWINGHDEDNSGMVLWLNTRKNASYTNWYSNSPDHQYETCIVSSIDFKGEWNDISCRELRPVVCELDAI